MPGQAGYDQKAEYNQKSQADVPKLIKHKSRDSQVMSSQLLIYLHRIG